MTLQEFQALQVGDVIEDENEGGEAVVFALGGDSIGTVWQSPTDIYGVWYEHDAESLRMFKVKSKVISRENF